MGPAEILALVGAIIFIGFFGDLLFQYKKIPSNLILIAVGLLIGPISKLVDPAWLEPAKGLFGQLALIIIMLEGGLNLSFAATIAYLGHTIIITFLTFLLTGAGIFSIFYFAFSFDLFPAILLAVMCSNVSGAIVIPLILKLGGGEDTRTILSLESAITDIIVIVSVFVIIDISGMAQVTSKDVFNQFAGQFSISIVIGFFAGILWIKFLEWAAATPLSYMTTMAATLLVYSLSEFAKASGPMAVMVYGLVLSNGERFLQLFVPGKTFHLDRKITEFNQEFTFFVSTYFFVYLGILVSFKALTREVIVLSIVLFCIIIVVRYLCVGILSRLSGIFKKDQLIYFAMIPRGLAIAVLAGLPAARGVPATDNFVFYAFCIILLTNIFLTAMIFYAESRAKKVVPT